MEILHDKKQCISCTACFNICPTKSITMEEDKEGFKYPRINKETCINCGLCKKVCPILNRVDKSSRLMKPTVIAAWSKDNNVRLDSTSGGIFSELAKQIYKENGYICGAVYNEEWLVEHYISDNEKDIDQLRSSKYLQSDMKDNFRKIKELLENGKKVLICGSPCQIAGLYNFLHQKEYENLYTCDFICRGMNSPKIFKGYINELEEQYDSKVKKIKFKNKIHGWHNFSTKIDFENGKSYIGGRYVDSYMVGYLHYNAFMRPSCYDCKFKDLPRVADITLADFWGIENINPKLDNDRGTSMVLLNSIKGRELFDKVKENIKYEEVISDKVFTENVCMNKSVEMTEARRNVFENIDKMSYAELSEKFFPQPNFVEKVKIKIRTNKALKKFKRVIRPIYRKFFKEKFK